MIPKHQAVLYARVSSKDQEREGYSIPAQQKLLRRYGTQLDMTLIREFLDVETAKETGRTGFNAMLEFLKANPSCRTILVEKTDRLYRNIRDWVTVDELDLEVHFVKENAVVSKASRSSEKFLHGIKVLVAKQYVDNLSEEVKKGLREKAEQGYWPSVAPVGYINNLATHRIEVDSVRGPQITYIFDLYATGEYSLKALTEKAHAIGLTHPRSGRRMMKAEIHRILRNPIYAGDFRWAGKMYKGVHEPLVTREQFAEVQSVLTRKPRARYPKQKHAFMGLLACARCGCSLTAERKKGKYTYYRCTGYRGRCGNSYSKGHRAGLKSRSAQNGTRESHQPLPIQQVRTDTLRSSPMRINGRTPPARRTRVGPTRIGRQRGHRRAHPRVMCPSVPGPWNQPDHTFDMCPDPMRPT